MVKLLDCVLHATLVLLYYDSSSLILLYDTYIYMGYIVA